MQAAQIARDSRSPASFAHGLATRRRNEKEAAEKERARLYKEGRGRGLRRATVVTPTVTPVSVAKKRPRSSSKKGSDKRKRLRNDWDKEAGVNRVADDSKNGSGLFLGLSQEQLQAIDEWIQFVRDADDEEPLTRASLIYHVREETGTELSVNAAGALFKHLHYEYVDPGSGYLENRAHLESTKQHFRLVAPLIEMFDADDRFVVGYSDESKPKTSKRRKQLWTKDKEHGSRTERVDKRRKFSGVAIHVSGIVCSDVGGILQDKNGVHIGGFAIASEPDFKHDAEWFIRTTVAQVARLQELYPDQIVVTYQDCPSWHRKSHERLNQRAHNYSLTQLKRLLISGLVGRRFGPGNCP